MAVMQGDSMHTVQTLMHEDLNLQETVFEENPHRRRYQEKLEELLRSKETNSSPWIVHR